MRNMAMEFTGTFFLALTIGLSVASGSALAPLAIGLSLAVMVYCGGHVSGAHYNPAVTLSVFVRGRISAKQVPAYWGSQVLGGLAAGLVAEFVLGYAFAGPTPSSTASLGQALAVEFLFTFALALVVLSTATAEGTVGNYIYGLAIGLTVTVGAYAGGWISGGAFNPAVYFGPVLSSPGALTGSNALLYSLGPLGGGAAAGLFFLYVNEEEKRAAALEEEPLIDDEDDEPSAA